MASVTVDVDWKGPIECPLNQISTRGFLRGRGNIWLQRQRQQRSGMMPGDSG